MNYYLEALRKYADFSGRARRSEYWFFALFTFVIYVALLIPAMALGGLASRSTHSPLAGLFILPALFFILAMIIPGLAVTVRRLHDTGRSGWWYFVCLVPFFGSILLLIFALLDSEPGPNLYGPSPKYGGYNMGYPVPPQYPPQPPYPPQNPS